MAQVAPQQFKSLGLYVDLVMPRPFLFIYLTDAFHQRFGRRLHFTTTVVIIFKLFLETVCSVLLFCEIVLIDFKQLIRRFVRFSKVLQNLYIKSRIALIINFLFIFSIGCNLGSDYSQCGL